MKIAAAISVLKQAAAEGRWLAFECENPHWLMRYDSMGKTFDWEFICGCGLEDCAADDLTEYPNAEEFEAAIADWIKDDRWEWTEIKPPAWAQA